MSLSFFEFRLLVYFKLLPTTWVIKLAKQPPTPPPTKFTLSLINTNDKKQLSQQCHIQIVLHRENVLSEDIAFRTE